MKKIIYSLVGLVAITGLIVGANYFSVGAPLSDILKADSRNAGIEASTHYEFFILPSVLIFDLKQVSDTKSPADVFRVFLQFASRVKDKNFERVQLTHQGTVKFELKGDFFKKLGQEFGDQNPIYTMRTFPENVYRPDGTQAFGSWTGGILGVLGKQMNDFNEFHQEWYITDMVSMSVK